MDIVLTGTGSPLPDANRAGPSTLVKADDTHILVDAGRGVVMRMTPPARCRASLPQSSSPISTATTFALSTTSSPLTG